MSNRDDFKQKTITELAKRVAWQCSNPNCQRATVGAKSGSEGVIITGIAAHITAAAPGGPRYNPALTPDQRKHINNGIWLCSNCSILIDRDEDAFPVSLLDDWKRTAESRSFAAIAGSSIDAQLIRKIPVEMDEADLEIIRSLSLPQDDDVEKVIVRLRNAAKIDIKTFKDERGWPKHVVPINMTSEDTSGVHIFSIAGVATAMEIVNEISIIAAPGHGKTTTMVQLADTILASEGGIAVVIPLAEWAMQSDTFFRMLTQRNAFRDFREQHFMLLACHGRLQLMLDGWNELEYGAKLRVSKQIKTLKREFPRIKIAISTRPQVGDLPIAGTKLELKALSDEQQQEIALVLLGDNGIALLEQAWQTDGVSELVAIPLYLNWLLSYASIGEMPKTREEILNRFVTEYEKEQERALILRQKLLGCHQVILVGLASKAISASNTVIRDDMARAVISQIENDLIIKGQITGRPEPQDVLDTLVNQHLLVWSSGNAGISFQHQQIQEWYASFDVEKLMLAAEEGDVEAVKQLSFNILNLPLWEEPILFACERLSHRDSKSVKAVAAAILQSITVDPMLAAEMIYRSSTGVWDIIQDEIKAFALRWHKPGKVDRAIGFMITTGRPEFAEQIWPLVTHDDDQIHLKALCAARQFRPSVLGTSIQERLATVPEEVRESVLAEIAMKSGLDGINIVTNIAKTEASTKVQFAVIESLLFRRAERFAIAIIKAAKEDIWQMLACRNYASEITDVEIAERWKKEHLAYITEEINVLKKLNLLLDDGEISPYIGKQVEDIIVSDEFPIGDNNAYWTLVKAKDQYLQEVKRGILRRIETGSKTPYGSIDLLRDAGVVEEGAIIDLIVNTAQENRFADEATVIAGPKTVSVLIEKLLKLDKKIQEMDGPIEEITRSEYWRLIDRISHSQSSSLITALQSYSNTRDPHIIAVLADIIARHAQKNETELLNMDKDLQEFLVRTINQWVEMLKSLSASREQLSSVVRVISFFPKPELFARLQSLLMEDLSQWKRAKHEFAANPRDRHASQDATICYTNIYKDAFSAIGGDKVTQLMLQYLSDLDFGIEAAYVLKIIWDKQQGDYERKAFKPWPDFSEVAARHLRRQQEGIICESQSPFAEAIFSAIHDINASTCTDKEHRHMLKLAKIALSMPHGDKGSIAFDLLQVPLPLSEKLELLKTLVIAGYKIEADMCIQGLKELLEDAKKKPWLLNEQHNQIEEWLQLLPFSNRPEALVEALDLGKEHLKEPRRLQQLLAALAYAPNTPAELSLFELAEADPRFYKDYYWLNAVVLRDTALAAKRILNLVCSGKVAGNQHGLLSGSIADLVVRHPDVYHNLLQRYNLLSATDKSRIKPLIAEIAKEEGLLVLVQSYGEEGLKFDRVLEEMINEIAVGKKTLPHVYEYYSVDVSDLRKKLFAMVNEAGAAANVAASCLELIDELRDKYGSVDTEPRHPDIESGRPWPLVTHV
ncbi:hypothetical protein RVY78_09625 [Veillonella sp. YH-vei2232]|uniref:NACHT C-terminal Alpha/Beta 2 domain-containing protein n=1 Tax=Veillonella absiana TaxID=3079305 RepID=A0ABU3ZB47_9FIRM|nr:MULTISPECIES: hypothetical protein [unclassified Veillonella]MDV5064204.1 hypothetical protein [Veillonella sp. YH-vei2232]MDV5089145.1 hypothetical protein [Veillonella sp. YH-vei2233]